MRTLGLPAAIGAVVAAALLTAACGGGIEPAAGELTLDLAVDGELRAGEPVTWRLEVENGTAAPVTLTFPDARRGEVTLGRDGEEVYRWSDGRMFSQVVERDALAPGSSLVYELEEPVLDVEPGEYELVAELTSDLAPDPVRRRVTVAG